MRKVEKNSFRQSGYAVGMMLGLLVGCDSKSATEAEKSTPEPIAAVAAEHWELSGVFQFPENEVATNLKIVATADPLSHWATSFASKPVPLVLTGGTPPTATFRLEIDSRMPTGISVLNRIVLRVFQDANGNDVNDAGEEARYVNTSTGCAVWCGDLVGCTSSASFLFVPKGTSGTGANGTFKIDTAGWYYQQGCHDYSCARLVAAGASLTGAVLVYSYYDDDPIQPPK